MKRQKSSQPNFDLVDIQPRTPAQKRVFQTNKHAVLSGCAGTGKSFITSFLAYRDVLQERNFNQLIYIRSAVATRAIGFYPGSPGEKVSMYESPYETIATELFNRGDAYEIMKKRDVVKFESTCHLRGETLRNAVIIADECQNMTMHELDTIMTRPDDSCRLFFCGDFQQADLKDNGIKEFYSILKRMGEFEFVEFGLEDIVRGGLVKRYLETKYAQSHTKQSDLFGDATRI